MYARLSRFDGRVSLVGIRDKYQTQLPQQFKPDILVMGAVVLPDEWYHSTQNGDEYSRPHCGLRVNDLQMTQSRDEPLQFDPRTRSTNVSS